MVSFFFTINEGTDRKIFNISKLTPSGVDQPTKTKTKTTIVCVYKHNNISKKTIEYNRLNNTRIIMAAMKISTFFLTMSILLQLSMAQGKNYVCSSCFFQISLNLSLIARMTPCETY